MSSANITDISDKGWDELKDADREVLQELGKERDGIDGRWGNEALAAALLAWHGRHEELPEDVREEYADEIQRAIETALQADDGPDDTETQVVDEGEGDDEEAEEEPAEPPAADDRPVEEEPEEDSGRDERLDNVGNPDKPPQEGATFIIDADVLQRWFDYPDALVDESRIHLSHDGLRITAVDPANVGMVNTDLRAAGFESFDVGDVGPIGVNLGRLIDVVGGASAGQLVQITFDAERRNLVVEYGGHRFTLALIDPASIRKEPDIPNLDLPAEATFHEAGTLRTAIEHGDSVSDHIGMLAREGDDGIRQFVVRAEGDTDDYEGAFVADDEIEWGRYGEARSLFSNDYMKPISKAWERTEPVTVELGEEFPVVLTQAVTVDDHEVGEAQYLLAPRIQSD